MAILFKSRRRSRTLGIEVADRHAGETFEGLRSSRAPAVPPGAPPTCRYMRRSSLWPGPCYPDGDTDSGTCRHPDNRANHDRRIF